MTMTTDTPTRCISVRNVPGGGRRYYAPAVYAARPRKDGTMTWRCVNFAPMGAKWCHGHPYPMGRRSEALADADAEALAGQLGLPVQFGVRHGTPA